MTANLQPGPELDALVAQKVMGWPQCTKGIIGSSLPHCFMTPDGRELRPGKDWSPSTRIEHAWEVVERLQDLGWSVTTLSSTGNPEIRPRVFTARAPTAPHAICLAALQATEETP